MASCRRSTSASTCRLRSSIRSGKIACDAQQLGIDDAQQLASTGAVAVGLALRKAGDR